MSGAQRSRTVRRIAAFFRPYRWQVALVMATIVVTSLLGVVNPYLLKLLLDEAIPQRDMRQLNVLVALMIALPIISGLISVGQTWLNNMVGQHVMQDLRNALYAHLQRMPLRFFTETRTGEIQSRLANDVGGIQSVVTDTASSVFSNLIITITTLLAMLWLSWQLTLMSLVVLPFFLWLTWRVGRVRREISSQTQQRLADITAITEETLSVSGILLSKTFGQQEASVARYRTANASLARLAIRQSMVGRWFFMIVGTIFSILPAFVYWLAGWLAVQGDPSAPTVGDIVAFTTLQSRLFFPLGQLLNVQVEIHGALALFDRIFEYLDLRPSIVDAPDAVTLDPAAVRGRIRFRHVAFRYPVETPPTPAGSADDDGGRPSDGAAGPRTDEGPRAPRTPFALEDIDFEVEPGRLVALVGHSGSGKTTTTYLVPRLYDRRGRRRHRRRRRASHPDRESGEVVGFVTQEAHLFHSSVRDNPRMCATRRHRRGARGGRAHGCHPRAIMELPDGYDTVVGERATVSPAARSSASRWPGCCSRTRAPHPRQPRAPSTRGASGRSRRRSNAPWQGRTTLAIAHRLSTILRADLILG
ncbi:MAG: ABC transporter transmembrane domain-containing protein [Chloroflexota bacterium]